MCQNYIKSLTMLYRWTFLSPPPLFFLFLTFMIIFHSWSFFTFIYRFITWLKKKSLKSFLTNILKFLMKPDIFSLFSLLSCTYILQPFFKNLYFILQFTIKYVQLFSLLGTCHHSGWIINVNKLNFDVICNKVNLFIFFEIFMESPRSLLNSLMSNLLSWACVGCTVIWVRAYFKKWLL